MLRSICAMLFTILLAAVTTSAAPPADFAAATAMSERTGKPLLLDFMADW